MSSAAKILLIEDDAGITDTLRRVFSEEGHDVSVQKRGDDGLAPRGAAFAALLKFVRRRIGELADELIKGVIDVRPYRMGRATPCPQCEFRSVCRFDAGINRYLPLPPMKRSEVLKIIVEEADDGA